MPAIPPVILFEDGYADQIGPLALTRPVFRLVCGGLTLLERWVLITGMDPRDAFLRAHLAPLERERGLLTVTPVGSGASHRAAPPVVPPAASSRATAPAAVDSSAGPNPADECLYVNAAYRAEQESWKEIASLPEETVLLTGDDRVLALRTRLGGEPAGRDLLRAYLCGGPAEIPPTLTSRPAGACALLRHAWDLAAAHEERLHADLNLIVERISLAPFDPAAAHAECHVQGGRVYAAPDVAVEGPCVFDSRHGPILLAAGARVLPFSHLRGPLYVGPHARVLGGSLSGSYIGPHCRVRGEVASSVLLGYANKAHDGFIGHSYVGEWVNLGALTTTSDLKNNYGIIRMREPSPPSTTAEDTSGDGWVERVTGQIKLGSFLADHAKTAIGTLLSAGTVLGVGANLFGAAGSAPRWMPSFGWGCGAKSASYDWERFIETACVVMDRRGCSMRAAEREVLANVFERTREARQTFIDSERE